MKKNIFLGFLLVVIGILLIFLSANYFVFRYFEHILYYWFPIILIFLGIVLIFKNSNTNN